MKNRTAPRRLAAVVAGLAAGALMLSGCLYASIPETAPSQTKPPVTDGVSDDLLPYYSQTLEWSSCVTTGYDCATVTAPLDWEDPDKGEIELAIVRHQAEGTAVGSLLVNPGGPGGSGYDYIAESIDYAVDQELIDNFDVVGFDPRGVGRSSAVSCLDDAATDVYLYDIPAAERGTPEWEEELTAANKEYAEACEANSNGILPYITTANSARDMDLLRAVLGDEQLHYLGYSYGTFLGATYAKLYPERASRLVLDGAIDPAIPSIDVGTTQALGFESALRAFMADCLQTEECPFSGTVDEAMTDLGALLASTDRTPLPGGDGREVGADTMMTGIIAALYSPDSWPYLSQALTAALQGDGSIILYLADFYNDREDGTYTSNSSEAFRAYNCMDYPADDDQAAEDAATQKVKEGAPTVAPYWEGVDVCADWPYPATGTRGAITAEGSGPIVVVGTTGDPATPYEWAVSLADQLAEGVLVTYVGEGHTGYNKGDLCVNKAVDDFLISGTVPEDGLRCE